MRQQKYVVYHYIKFCSFCFFLGVLPDIKNYYVNKDGEPLSDADAGLLQTSFIVFYMLFSPLFGYLGDRYNRKLLMAVGIFAWSAVTLAGSFIPAQVHYLLTFFAENFDAQIMKDY